MSLGKSIKHDSAQTHVTGESIFVDDRAELSGELHVGIVGSPIAHGKILKIDFSKLKEHEDFVGEITARDLAHNSWGTIVHDQPILASDKVSYKDEAIALVISKSRFSLEEMISQVKIECEEYGIISTIHEAIDKDQVLYQAPTPFKRGDLAHGFQQADHILDGWFECGGQEHFYMESQACIAYPQEAGQMEVHSSSQHPSETQRLVSEALGLELNKVVCIVKRMGGGFGGKESQAAPIAVYAAVAAQKFKKPARCILTKDQDMMLTGKRHPFSNKFKIGFTNEGIITALDVELHSDGGAYSDLSASILERGMFHTDGAYFLENVSIKAKCLKTNNHPNTAFRGFGGPQGNFTIESIFEDMAFILNKDPFEIRRLNIYEGKRNITPYGQEVENNMLPKLFDELYQKSEYEKRLLEIKKFNNQQNGYVKGLSVCATKFGIAFTARFLNQGNALVALQLDGSIQVSTGATEMGQGVNTKIAQVASTVFSMPIEKVLVMTTSTEKNHNTSPTAASSGADINCAATLKAANKIKNRLASLAELIFSGVKSDEINEYEVNDKNYNTEIEFKDERVYHLKSDQSIDLAELIGIAYFNRISMGEYAHFKTPGLGFCKNTVQGKAFNYFSQGLALSEVTIDEYTGQMKVDRVDLLMDLGRTMNPGVDLGQVSGAFIQGMGWVTNEKLVYDEKLNLLSHSPTTYKIPNIQDTPRIFNMELIENNENEVNVYKTKAVGEPPFILGMSVWTAAKNAIYARIKFNDPINLKSPATPEEILMCLESAKEKHFGESK